LDPSFRDPQQLSKLQHPRPFHMFRNPVALLTRDLGLV
jgi:hypothetical protein